MSHVPCPLFPEESMQLAMIGLGKMGGNMTERLLRGGHKVVGFDRAADVVGKYKKLGANGAGTVADAVKQLSAPRIVWIMVPAGQPTQDTIDELAGLLADGDVIIDGGNSNFHDTMRRGAELKKRGI